MRQVQILLLTAITCLASCKTVEQPKIVTIPVENIQHIIPPASIVKEYMGEPTRLITMNIADGKVALLLVTDSGPIPVENEYVKVHIPQLIARPVQETGGFANLMWVFGFSSKNIGELTSVSVEQVFPSETPISIVQDVTPKFTSQDWLGTSKTSKLNSTLVPWLFENGTSSFVYRFTIIPKVGSKIVLLQLVSITEQEKHQLRKLPNQ